MKKLILYALLIFAIETSFAQYSNATLNGPWFWNLTPLTPYNDSLLYLVFDGNAHIIAGNMFGDVSGSYSVNASGAITGILIVNSSPIPWTGQLTSQNGGTAILVGRNFTMSRVTNPGALADTLVGSLYTQNCGQNNVSIILNSQGIVVSAIGLIAPVSGRIYTHLGVYMGHLETGDPNEWDEFTIRGYFANDILNGVITLDGGACGNTVVNLVRKGGTGIDPINVNASEIILYPNPANSKITIANNGDLQKETFINIYNVQGKQVISNTFNYQNSMDMDVSSLANGIYMIKIQTEKGFAVKKLLIQK